MRNTENPLPVLGKWEKGYTPGIPVTDLVLAEQDQGLFLALLKSRMN